MTTQQDSVDVERLGWRLERIIEDGGPLTVTDKAVLREAIAALSLPITQRDEQGEQWRDIASAPRDGTQFLALVSNGWHALVSAPVEALREGWPYQWWRSDDRQNYPVVNTHPADYDWPSFTLLLTHWMPLPPDPSIRRLSIEQGDQDGGAE